MRTPVVVGIGGAVAGMVVLSIAAASTSSATPRVAVIDTGIAPNAGFADLEPGVICSPVCSPGDPADPDGHGTSVAAAIDHGVLVPVQVTTSSKQLESAALTQAVKWVASQNIPIANVSLSWIGTDSDLDSALAEASSTLFIVAAGNDGTDIDQRKLPVMPCTSPAPNVLCVTSRNADGRLTDRANSGSKSVDLYADGSSVPAVDVNGKRKRVSGTAYAAAKVTASAALIVTENPHISPGELKSRLLAAQ